jgi:alpha-glucosidase
MERIDLDSIDQFTDGIGILAYNLMIERGVEQAEALRIANRVGRDECRSPMQWDNTPNAGFSPEGVKTWLPVNPNYADGVNVAAQKDDPTSLLSFFRKLVLTRQQNVALRRGEMEILKDTGSAFMFWRRHPDQTCLVALNLSDEPLNIEDYVQASELIPVFSTDNEANLLLAPYEIFVAQV